MYSIRVNLVTESDICDFVNIAITITNDVLLKDNDGHCVNAKSLLGCMYSVEFNESYVISDYPNLASKFINYIV